MQKNSMQQKASMNIKDGVVHSNEPVATHMHLTSKIHKKRLFLLCRYLLLENEIRGTELPLTNQTSAWLQAYSERTAPEFKMINIGEQQFVVTT